MSPMRAVRFAATILIGCLIASVASMAVVGADRRTAFDAQAATLQRAWTRDIAVGVPASSIAPLRIRLAKQRPDGQWWAPVWWTTNGQSLLNSLAQATDAAYAAAMKVQRDRAELVLFDWQLEVGQQQTYMSAAEAAAGQDWPAELSAATTPDRIAALATAWQEQLDTARTDVLAAQQQAMLEADVARAGGPAALISQAAAAVTEASQDNLDPGPVPNLLAQLQSEESAGDDPTQTSGLLYSALYQLSQLFSLNDQLNGEMRPLMLLADQAAAEGTPNSANYLSQYQTLDQTFLADTTYDELSPLQSQAVSLQAAITTELANNQCGHEVGGGSGKVIYVSISLEEAVFYDNGCAVNATPVTAGRPGFPTLTGSFNVFYKSSPFEFISPWPLGSPGYYLPTWVDYAMEYEVGGFFLHDAYWEDQNAFGPGSQYEVEADNASHGCIHIPSTVMPWLYSWTPLGTPVIVVN
jgi:lipoprotein-anchoring transpeptidase ErfK/SrfK